MAKVLAVPDMHSPYTNLRALTNLYDHIKREKPDVVIQMGDALDCYAFSKFPKSANVMTPKQEINEGILLMREFWKLVKEAAPQAQLAQLVGNHEERLPKRILERLPEFESLFSLKELMSFDGVDTVIDPETLIDDVVYTHGYMTKPYAHMRFYQRSVVFGHTHNAWCVWEKLVRSEKMMFDFTCGFLGDDTLIPLKYTASKKNKWSTGYGLIIDGIPCFVPL